MKKLSLIVALSALTLGAFAQGNTPAAKTKVMHCPVEHDAVNMAKATKKHMYADYKGRRYFFCCNGCPQKFAKNPAKYSKNADSIPTPKTKPAK